jgi:tRNA nucleotidyltransferase (CCA-adding enzyme)
VTAENTDLPMDVIVCHLNADFDCISSILGAKKIYPNAIAVLPGSEEKKVREFLQNFHPFDIKRASDIELESITRLIVVDTSNAARLGPLSRLLNSDKVRIHLYDHHPNTENRIRAELEIIEDVGATATIFTEIIKKRRIPITPLEATVLCLGIYEETGSLRFPTTTERDLMAVAYLLRRGANLNIVSEYIKIELSKDDLELLNELLASSKDIFQYGIKIKVVKASRREYVVDAAALAHRLMDIEDIDGVVMLLEMEGKVIIICRSRVPEFDVSRLLEEFDGGGHPAAGSASLKGIPLEIVEEMILDRLKKTIRPQRVVRDIMTSPVITTEYNTTIKEAEVLMTRYGVNVLPVVRAGSYYGLLSREVVEKALLHGFGKSKVHEFATTDAETTSPDAPLEEVERIMVEHNQRFMPVIEGQRVVGCITRTDLLRNLYEETLRRKRIEETEVSERPSIGRNIANLIKERFPNFIVQLLNDAGGVADTLGYRAYLVGGSVRDLLRGEQNLDIDIVIEGDGITFANALAERLTNVKVVTHRRFNTAKLIFSKRLHPQVPFDNFTVDIATARTEYYESPASLPRVETSSIKKDLYRRDFTINTLAVKLNPDEFGLLIDYFGGQRDIKEKVIRVLHNLSFVEDPTRAFRAVRFAERFNFHISRHTEKLIKSAVKLNLFEKLSGTRLYDELVLIFRETEPIESLRRLGHYGLLSTIHPEIRMNKRLQNLIRSIKDTLTWYNLLFLEEPIQKELLYIMALIITVPETDRAKVLQRLSIPPRQARLVHETITRTHHIKTRLKTDDPVEIYNTLQPYQLETILFVMAISDDRDIQKSISRYLLELRDIKPLLKGKDLIEMGYKPGPIFSEILSSILKEKLRGRLRNIEEERRFVLDRYAKALS